MGKLGLWLGSAGGAFASVSCLPAESAPCCFGAASVLASSAAAEAAPENLRLPGPHFPGKSSSLVDRGRLANVGADFRCLVAGECGSAARTAFIGWHGQKNVD